VGQIKNKKLLYKSAQKLKELRNEKGITIEQFYNDTGIHVGRIEQGKSSITISTLKAICDYLKISLAVFFTLIEE
jgi:transcriptional regulator with XRE-family HTH domain